MMDTSLQELFQAGKQYFETKNYRRAEPCFVKLLQLGGRYADVLNMLGVIYHAEGKFDNAADCFRKALEINPHYTEATLNLAVLYNDLGEFKKSKALYEQVKPTEGSMAELDPVMKGKLANQHAALADTYRGIGRYTEAIRQYREALGLCPTFPDIKTKLGISHRENNEPAEALRELKEAVALEENYLPAWLQLGLTHYTLGEKDKAIAAWRQVLKHNPEHDVAQMYLRLCGEGKAPAAGKKPKAGKRKAK